MIVLPCPAQPSAAWRNHQTRRRRPNHPPTGARPPFPPLARPSLHHMRDKFVTL